MIKVHIKQLNQNKYQSKIQVVNMHIILCFYNTHKVGGPPHGIFKNTSILNNYFKNILEWRKVDLACIAINIFSF